MESVNLPKGLIRYASEDEIEKKAPFVFTARMKGYTALLVILIGIFIGLLFLRNDVQATVLRLPGQLFEHKGDKISNVYTYKIINKTTKDYTDVHFEILEPKGTIKNVGNSDLILKREGVSQGTLFIEINQALLDGDKTKVKIGVYNGNKLLETTTTNFLGPRTFN